MIDKIQASMADAVRVIADGALYVVGRLKEMIIRSGFNVYPGEVEAVLGAFPGIQSAAVVGRRLSNDPQRKGAQKKLAEALSSRKLRPDTGCLYWLYWRGVMRADRIDQ